MPLITSSSRQSSDLPHKRNGTSMEWDSDQTDICMTLSSEPQNTSVQSTLVMALMDTSMILSNELQDHAITVLVTENTIMVSDQMAIFMILSRNKVYLKTFLVIYCKQGFLYMVGLQKTQQFEIHYTRLGTSINCSLHYTWIQYQVAHLEL